MSGKLLLGGAFAALATASAVVSRVFSSSASTPAAALSRDEMVKPTVSKDMLLTVLEACLQNVKECTNNIYLWSKSKASELRSRRLSMDEKFLLLAKQTYEKELARADAKTFKDMKTNESQVAAALAYNEGDEEVRKAVAEIKNAGPKITFDPDELITLYEEIFEVQLVHMEEAADELAEMGVPRGSEAFQAAVRERLKVDAESIKHNQLAKHGLVGVQSFLEANLDMYCSNDTAMSIKFNKLLSAQQRRAVACGAKSK